MHKEDQYFNRNRETPISSKNLNDLKEKKFINSFNYDETNKNTTNVKNYDYSASELSKKSKSISRDKIFKIHKNLKRLWCYFFS